MSIKVRPSPLNEAATGEKRTRGAETLECCDELVSLADIPLSSLCIESGGVGLVGVPPPDPPPLPPALEEFHALLLLPDPHPPMTLLTTE